MQSNQSADVWHALLGDLLHQLDIGQKGITRARKKEQIERLLEIHSSSSEQLQQKLAVTIRSWAGYPSETIGIAPSGNEIAVAQTDAMMMARHPMPLVVVPSSASDNLADTHGLRDLLGQVLDVGLGGLLAYEPTLASDTEALARQVQNARTPHDFAALKSATKSYLLKVELTAANNSDLHQGMLRLLRLVIDNVAELVGEDDWMRGQIKALAEIVSQPLDLVMIEHAERSMKDAILRQGTLRHSLSEAKGALKSMVSNFVNRLGDFSADAGEYQEKIEKLSSQIHGTDDLIVLGQLLEEVSSATRSVQAATQRSRDDVLQSQQQVQVAEQQIRSLQSELARVSAKVREDQLTGALNRRGLEEEYERACAASERRREPLSVALLDIDDFKALNDTHGHQTGDEALVHLAKVIKSTVRPTDVVCRYGGEEFVVLLPGSRLEDAVTAMTRLQRELTKRFFLRDNQRILLTFSAGVAERRMRETRDETIGRADGAMYVAKRSGKNRVVSAK